MEAIIFGLIAVIALFMLYVMFTEMLNFVQTRVPFVPTAKADLDYMVQKVKITGTDYVFDIGSGNGKVIFHIERTTGARGLGLQRAGWSQSYAKLRRLLTRSKSKFVSGDFFNYPWSEATVIYAYLYPFLMNQVAEKALAECRPGTRLVVRDFPITSLQPVETWQTPSNHTMFLYVI